MVFAKQRRWPEACTIGRAPVRAILIRKGPAVPSVASNISALPLPLPVPSRPDPVPAADGPDDFTNLLDSVSASDAPPVPQGPPARASSLPPPEDPAPPRGADPHANAPGSTDSPADAQGPSDPRNPSDSQGAANASDPEESRDAPKPVDVHGRDLPGTKTKGATNASPRALAVLTALAARLGIHPAPLAAAGQDPVATPGDPQPGAGSDGPAPAKDDKPGKTEEAPVIDASAGPVDPTLTLTAQPTIAPAAVAAVPADPTTTTPAPAPSGTAPINATADAADVKTA